MDNVAEPRQARRKAAKSIDAERDIGRYSASFGVSLGLMSLFNALLVIVKESNPDTVLAWMAAATGHHWVTQGVLVLLVFAVLGLALTRLGEAWRFRPDLVIASVVGGVVVGSLVIAGFFL